MVIWLLVMLIAAICLGLLSYYVLHQPVASWDQAFTHRGISNSPVWRWVANLSDPRLVVGYDIALASILCLQNHLMQAMWVIVTLGIADILGIIIKQLVRRPRPATVRAHYSFPSGHVLSATVMALMMVVTYRQVGVRLLIIILWLLITLSRLLLKAHYLSDILAAICLALFVFALTMAVFY